MNSAVNVWMQHSKDDLDAAQNLISFENLTNIVSYHSQQCIEKSFKAIMELCKMDIIHTHDLLKLHKLIENKLKFDIDEKTLIEINEIYSEARYPSLLGSLPYGKPTVEEARKFLEFAKYIYTNISESFAIL